MKLMVKRVAMRPILLLLLAAGILAIMALPGRWRTHRHPGWSALLHAVGSCQFLSGTCDAPSSALISAPSAPRAFAARMPARVVWAWEEPEDLRNLPATVGVAYLAETLLLGDLLRVVPRRQPLRVDANAPVMAVVRVETSSGFADSAESRDAMVRQLAQVATRPGVRALQIDFDASASQLPFYRAFLQALRLAMPAGEPLSITALASWCGERSWLQDLPLDEAVPMLFRMGGPRETAPANHGRYPLRETLCRGSRGISIDEPRPGVLRTLNPETRLYLFAPKPWRSWQQEAVAVAALPALSEALDGTPLQALEKTTPNRDIAR